MSKKPDLRSLAASILDADGDFDEVHILGGLTTKGSLNANIIDIIGSAKIKGSLWAQNVDIKGGAKIGEDLIVDLDISIIGGLETGGKLQGKNITISGGIETGEGIKATNLLVKGGVQAMGAIISENLIDITGGITSESDIIAVDMNSVGGFSATGKVKVARKISTIGQIEVDGNVECDEFTFAINGPSTIHGKLQANKIKIYLDENAKRESFLKVKEIISSKPIEIDYVIAERIVCPKVKAGENCRIGEAVDKAFQPRY